MNLKIKISKGTVFRAICTALIILNITLKKFGIDILGTEEDTAAALAEAVSEIAVILISFWKNNSFTQNARKADVYLKELNQK